MRETVDLRTVDLQSHGTPSWKPRGEIDVNEGTTGVGKSTTVYGKYMPTWV